MNNIVSITSQGQVTIPKEMRKMLGINGATKAVVKKVNNGILIEPKQDFWSLEGSLVSRVKLSDKDLRRAREQFSREFGKKA